VQQVSIGRNRVVTPEEIREVDTTNLVPESSKRAGYRLDSSSQWVPGNGLLHTLRDWNAEPSTHKQQVVQSVGDGQLDEDRYLEAAGSEGVDVVENIIVVKGRIGDG